jgi:hypothetical protein
VKYLDDEKLVVTRADSRELFAGLRKTRNAISTHCKGASIQGVPSNGGIQEMTIIPERV